MLQLARNTDDLPSFELASTTYPSWSAYELRDGFVVPVPKKSLPAYRRLSQKAGKVWREYGAIDYKECVGDDV